MFNQVRNYSLAMLFKTSHGAMEVVVNIPSLLCCVYGIMGNFRGQDFAQAGYSLICMYRNKEKLLNKCPVSSM